MTSGKKYVLKDKPRLRFELLLGVRPRSRIKIEKLRKKIPYTINGEMNKSSYFALNWSFTGDNVPVFEW